MYSTLFYKIRSYSKTRKSNISSISYESLIAPRYFYHGQIELLMGYREKAETYYQEFHQGHMHALADLHPK